jgi:hypothetical protein
VLGLVRRGLLAAGTVLGLDPGFCCVRVSATRVAICKLRARFPQKFTLEDAIGSHTCSLEALASV